jgi:hypothetical protein
MSGSSDDVGRSQAVELGDTTDRGRSATEAVSPPDSTTVPARRYWPLRPSVFTSHATAAAGWPIAAPAAAVPTTSPAERNTQPTSLRSPRSAGFRGTEPRLQQQPEIDFRPVLDNHVVEQHPEVGLVHTQQSLHRP